MALIFCLTIALLCGAVYHELVQYWFSRAVAYFRPESGLAGEWTIEYMRGDDVVKEKLVMYGVLADISYGDLYARTLDDSVTVYRARLEHFFGDTYSATIRPARARFADVGLGLLTFDRQAGTVTGRLVGLSTYRESQGEQAYVRTFKATADT